MVEYTGYEAMLAKLKDANSFFIDFYVMVGSSGFSVSISKGDAICLIERAPTAMKLICRTGEIEITGIKD